MSSTRGRVIARAYHDTGSLEAQCPSCGAPAGQYCTRRDDLSGETYRRRIPCLARIPATCSNESLVDDEATLASGADTRLADISPEATLAIDFSEPRHG